MYFVRAVYRLTERGPIIIEGLHLFSHLTESSDRRRLLRIVRLSAGRAGRSVGKCRCSRACLDRCPCSTALGLLIAADRSITAGKVGGRWRCQLVGCRQRGEAFGWGRSAPSVVVVTELSWRKVLSPRIDAVYMCSALG